MTIMEILKAKGIADEVAQAVLDDMKTNKIYTASEENLDIRYGKLKTQHDSVNQQLTEANALIADMKKSTKGQEELQGKITAYETQVTQLQAELQKAKLDAAIKVGLLSEKAVDVDYLTFKLNEKLKGDGETLTLDENGNIKGWKDKLDGLKTQFPTMFEAADGGNGDGYQVVDPLKMRKGDGNAAPTLDAFRNMTYEQRLALKQQNEAQYNTLRKQTYNN